MLYRWLQTQSIGVPEHPVSMDPGTCSPELKASQFWQPMHVSAQAAGLPTCTLTLMGAHSTQAAHAGAVGQCTAAAHITHTNTRFCVHARAHIQTHHTHTQKHAGGPCWRCWPMHSSSAQAARSAPGLTITDASQLNAPDGCARAVFRRSMLVLLAKRGTGGGGLTGKGDRSANTSSPRLLWCAALDPASAKGSLCHAGPRVSQTGSACIYSKSTPSSLWRKLWAHDDRAAPLSTWWE
eukprot:scaffold15721_cov21-Tisochrysis_lutea.AAC.3